MPDDLGLEPRHALREFAGEPGEHLAVDGDAAALHVAEHGDQRALQRLIDARLALGDEAGLQHAPQPQRDVGILGGIGGGLVDGGLVEADLALALAADLLVLDRRVLQPALGERVHAVRRGAGIEHIGQQHGVVIGRDIDAVAHQDQPVIFEVLADLQHATGLPAAASAPPARRGSGSGPGSTPSANSPSPPPRWASGM